MLPVPATRAAGSEMIGTVKSYNAEKGRLLREQSYQRPTLQYKFSRGLHPRLGLRHEPRSGEDIREGQVHLCLHRCTNKE